MKESHPVVAAEFDRTRFEMTMMSDRVQALQNFGDRAPTGAVRTLVSSLIQAERFGTSLVDTMRMIAEEQRTDRMMKAEERAARLPALITLPLILFILPGLFMIILGPAIIRLNQQGGLFGDADK
jgi:tight adherence protein C